MLEGNNLITLLVLIYRNGISYYNYFIRNIDKEGEKMSDYSLPKYDDYRQWIKSARERGIEWEKIKYGLKKDQNGLKEFLEEQRALNWWNIECNDWLQLVKLEKEAEEQTKAIQYLDGMR